jgi:hypothetical protein
MSESETNKFAFSSLVERMATTFRYLKELNFTKKQFEQAVAENTAIAEDIKKRLQKHCPHSRVIQRDGQINLPNNCLDQSPTVTVPLRKCIDCGKNEIGDADLSEIQEELSEFVARINAYINDNGDFRELTAEPIEVFEPLNSSESNKLSGESLQELWERYGEPDSSESSTERKKDH